MIIQGVPVEVSYSPRRGEVYIYDENDGLILTLDDSSFEGIDIDLDDCTEEELAAAIEEVLGADRLEDIVYKEDI